MKPFMSLVLTTAFSAAALAPAGAVTITLVPVSHSTTAPMVGATQYTPPCATPNVPAAVAGNPFIEIPAIADGMGASGTSTVQLSLLPSGKVAGASMVQSSGNKYLDDSALQSARFSTFVAETQGCVKVAGTYLYSVEF